MPLLAVLNTAVRYLASYDRGRPAREDKPPGTRPVDDEEAEDEATKDARAGEAGASVGTGATTVP